MAKSALITGIAGQAGSYLAELLLEKGYRVFGMVRSGGRPDALQRISHIREQLNIVSGDLSDQASLLEAIQKSEPDEVYNLAAQTFIPASWDQPVLTGEFTALGVTRLLEGIRATSTKIRFFQASSSEVFGSPRETPQTEETPFHPRSPYGVAKCYSHWITRNYREHYDMFACAGICYNHESPRRDPLFVTRKITQAVARIHLGLQDKLEMGRLDATRDWGFTGDCVRGMWLMLQQARPEDYIIATGVCRSVEEFCATAFAHVGLEWRKYVVTAPALVRPPDAIELRGNPNKARVELGWEPTTSFAALVGMMVDHDIQLLQKDVALAKKGGIT